MMDLAVQVAYTTRALLAVAAVAGTTWCRWLQRCGAAVVQK
jgi:hypothetical protein